MTLTLPPEDRFERAKQHFLDGLSAMQKENWARAKVAFVQSLDLLPDRVSTLVNLSTTLLKLKEHEEAAVVIAKILTLEESNAEALLNEGLLLVARKQFEQALARFDSLLSADPDNHQAGLNRALVLQALNRWDDALAAIDQALLSHPADAQAHCLRGNLLAALAQPEHAVASYDKALSLKPSYAEAFAGRARAFEQLKKLEQAEADYARVIALNPNHSTAYIDQGDFYRKNKALDLAVRAYEAAHALGPHAPYLKGKLLHAKMLCCDWSGLHALRAQIDQGVAAGEKVVDPFAYQAVASSEALLATCARIFSQDWFPLLCRDIPRAQKKQKIHIGYVCGEFRDQATSILLARIYELHDKRRFKIVAFDNGFDDGSELRGRLRNAFDDWVDISRLSDASAATEIRQRDIDILVNLNGYFGLARPRLFAMRPSPIQVNYLGFPGTLGAVYFDYLLADETVIPAQSQCHYDEKIVYLPYCYQANDDTRVVAPRQYSRAGLGLPNEGFVFCCFNNNYKITPECFAGWMRILKQVDHGVLWLYEDNPQVSKNLWREASLSGIEAHRLIFAKALQPAEHLARHALADLFLDTLPYNAHTTASDCLWAGLPLLTCTGNSFPGRVASSLLKALDLPELITDSQQQYEERAVWLAKNPEQLRLLRQQLAKNRGQSPLFDSALFTRHLERAYSTMVERHHAGLAPEAFSVPSASARSR